MSQPMSQQLVPVSAAPVITICAGAQVLRLPVAQLAERGASALSALDRWKRAAPGAQLAVYGTVKTAANVMLPWLPAILAPAVNAGLLPPLPERPRHSDPIAYVLGYIVAALPWAMARGEWRLAVDETGNVTGLDWTGAGGLGGGGGSDTSTAPASVVEEGK